MHKVLYGVLQVGEFFESGGNICDDLLHPLGNDLPFGDRVADILHVGFDAERSELVGDLHDSADLVGQFSGTDMNDIVAHEFLPSR